MARATPSISIVVPTHGRPVDLRHCLSALAELDYPRECFEVVVVDDGSPCPLDAVVAPFRQRCELHLRRQNRHGPASARNTGLATAKNEFVAFTADDCSPASDWLQQLARGFARYPGGAVGGRILNALPDNPFSTSTDLLISYLYDYYNRQPQQARFFTPNNLAFPRDQLRALGGFEPAFVTGEDRELCDRWRLAGHALVYAPEAVVTHIHPLNFTSFCRLHFQYGQGSSRYRHRSAQRQTGPVRFEALSFYVNLVRYPFTKMDGAQAMLLSGLLGVAQVANVAGFLSQSWTLHREHRTA